jgi:biotin carboxylase
VNITFIRVPSFSTGINLLFTDPAATVEVQILGSSRLSNSLAESIDCLFSSVTQADHFFKSDESLQIYTLDQHASTQLSIASCGSDGTYEHFLETLLTVSKSGKQKLVRFMVPLAEGFITRSDVISIRLQDCTLVDRVVSFAKPMQHYKGRAKGQLSSISAILLQATAAICTNIESVPDTDAARARLDQELDVRLSFPWILPEAPEVKTLALVTTNGAFLEYDQIGLTRAVTTLGVRLVVLDTTPHWLEKDTTTIDAFLPLHLTEPQTDDIAEEILASLKAYGKSIDGIMTFADTYWPSVAAAATKLGLPTAAPEALRIATNKYHTSVYAGHEAYHASSLDEALEVLSKHRLPYPVIVKPCGGWSSEGVSLVNTSEEFETAIRSINASRHGPEVVIEPYCDGPEFDINFVLQDGEVLFEEMCDDLPKTGDTNGPNVGSLCNFHELYGIYPSILPESELQMIRESFLDILLSLGLRDGVFHLEGRMEHSSVEYLPKDGIMELSDRTKPGIQVLKPKPWLLEINVRPPGMTSSRLMESTYGVDYWGLAVLSAIGDKKRVRALSQPFSTGPQYTAIMVFIPADFPLTCEGVYESDDVCADLMARRPDLRAHISSSNCLLKRGAKVPHPSTGRNTFVAVFNIFSRTSRAKAQAIAHEVRAAVRYSFR